MRTRPIFHPSRSLTIALLMVATLLAGLLVASSPAAAKTIFVTGHLTGNSVWTTGDTFIMVGNVTVDAGASLTIQPAAIVWANTAVRMYVNGVLQANGIAGSLITFAANGTAPRWGGIQFNASATGSVTFSTFDKADTAVAGVTSSPTVAHNLVTRAGTAFRFVNSASVSLSNNTVDRASLLGIDLVGSSGSVSGNSINNTALGIQARATGSLLLTANLVTNVSAGSSAGAASIGILVDSLNSVTLDRNTVQRVRGQDGVAPGIPGARGTNGSLAVGIFVNGTGVLVGSNNVVGLILGGRGGDGQGAPIGNGGNGGMGGVGAGILIFSAQAANLQGDQVSGITGGRGGNGGASTGTGGNGGNGGGGGIAVGIEAYNVLTSFATTGDATLTITGGPGGNGGAPSGLAHTYGSGGPGGDAYGIATAKAMSAGLSANSARTLQGGEGGNSTASLLLAASTSGGGGGQAIGIAVLGADGPITNPTVLHSNVISGASGGVGGIGVLRGGDGGNATGVLAFGDGKPFNATAASSNQITALSGGAGGASTNAGGDGGGAVGLIVSHVTPAFASNTIGTVTGGKGGSANALKPAGSGGQAAGIAAVQSMSGTSSRDSVQSVSNGSAGIGSPPPPAYGVGFFFLGNSTEKTTMTVSNGTVSGTSSYDLYVDNYTHVTTVNTTFTWSKVHVELNGNLTVRNFLAVRVLWPNGVTYVTGASIHVWDNGASAWNVVSPNGPAQWLLVTDRVYYGAKGFRDNTTNVSVMFPGAIFANDPRFVNMSASHTESFVMADQTTPTSSANQLLPYETTRRFTVTYVASDPRNGTGLKNVILWFKAPGKDWAFFQTQVTSGPGQFAFVALTDGPYAFVTIATDNSNNVQPWPANNNTWTIIDTNPPGSTVVALPAYENTIPFPVQWQNNTSVTDIATYTIQVNVGTGWVPWLVNTTATLANYTAAGQGPVAFRSLARDRAGNVEPKTGNDTWTVVDTIPPTVLATSPVGSGANATTLITVTFSEAMDTASVEAAFNVTPSTNGTYSWNSGSTVVTFHPSKPLRAGTTYTVVVATLAMDVAGNPLAQPAGFSFATPAAPPTGLSLSDLWPALLAIVAIAAGLLLFFILRRRGAASGEPALEPPKLVTAPAAGKQEAAIDDVFLLYRKDGILIKHETRRLRPDIDTDILSGMLTAVQQFVKDSFRGDEGDELNEMTVGQMHILIGRGKWLILAATITGGDVESMTNQIRQCVQDMEDHNWDRLEDWDGDMGLGKALTPYLKKLIQGVYTEVPQAPPAK